MPKVWSAQGLEDAVGLFLSKVAVVDTSVELGPRLVEDRLDQLIPADAVACCDLSEALVAVPNLVP